MKKSTITLLIGIAGTAVSFTVTNLKLRSEYNKGKIGSHMTSHPLLPFHHIKQVDPKEGETVYLKKIFLIQHKDSLALLHDYYQPPRVLFSVANDTLFLEQDPAQKNGYNIRIYCKDLYSVTTNGADISIPHLTTDSLHINAVENASVYCSRVQLASLQVRAGFNARVTVAFTDTIPYADILLHGNAEFKANDVTILKRKLTLSPVATLSLAGKSIDNFGIKIDQEIEHRQ